MNSAIKAQVEQLIRREFTAEQAEPILELFDQATYRAWDEGRQVGFRQGWERATARFSEAIEEVASA